MNVSAEQVIATGFDFSNRVRYVGGGHADGQIGTIKDFDLIGTQVMAVVEWDQPELATSAYAVAMTSICAI